MDFGKYSILASIEEPVDVSPDTVSKKMSAHERWGLLIMYGIIPDNIKMPHERSIDMILLLLFMVALGFLSKMK